VLNLVWHQETGIRRQVSAFSLKNLFPWAFFNEISILPVSVTWLHIKSSSHFELDAICKHDLHILRLTQCVKVTLGKGEKTPAGFAAFLGHDTSMNSYLKRL
jgi:hypothetical protein